MTGKVRISIAFASIVAVLAIYGLPSMGVSRVLLGVAGVAAGAAILCNLPTNPFVPAPKKATLPYLSGITLKTIEDKPRQFQAKELWEKGGAVIMAVRRPG